MLSTTQLRLMYVLLRVQEDFRNFWDACPWEEDLEYAQKVSSCVCIGVCVFVHVSVKACTVVHIEPAHMFGARHIGAHCSVFLVTQFTGAWLSLMFPCVFATPHPCPRCVTPLACP